MLAHNGKAGFICGAMVLHFLHIPPSANAKYKATAGDLIDASNGFCRNYWLMLRHQTNTSPNFQFLSDNSSSCASNKWVMSMAVALGKLTTTWPG
jgi:hypothetical protein